MNTEDTVRRDALDRALVEIGGKVQTDIAAALKRVYGGGKWPAVELRIRVIGEGESLWRRIAGAGTIRDAGWIRVGVVGEDVVENLGRPERVGAFAGQAARVLTGGVRDAVAVAEGVQCAVRVVRQGTGVGAD